jgi:uncharacterized membrane protein
MTGEMMDLVLCVINIALAYALLYLMCAAGSLKKHAKNKDAFDARFDRMPVVIFAGLLGLLSFFLRQEAIDNPSIGWMSYAAVFLGGVLAALWWLLHGPTVSKYKRERMLS